MSENIRGYQWAAGMTCPQIKLQITPLYWGIAASWSSNCCAVQAGPLAAQIFWSDYVLEVRAGWFDRRYATFKDGLRRSLAIWPRAIFAHKHK